MLSPRSQRINKNNKTRRNFSFLRFLFFLVGMAFVGVLFYALFFSSFLEITSISVNGNEYVGRDSVLEIINPEISGKYLNYIKKNNLLLIRTKKIEKEMGRDFKIIRESKIKRKFPSELVVEITERKPQMVFCSQQKCFLIDENGEAYDSYFTSEENDKNNFIILREESSREINIGEVILEKKYMEYIQGIRRELLIRLETEVENNFRSTSLISKDIRVKTKDGWEIYFNENIELEKEIEMLKVVLENKIEKNQRLDLEYVDLRIDNKIYYKFRDGTPSQIAKDATTSATAQSTAPASLTENKDKKKKD